VIEVSTGDGTPDGPGERDEAAVSQFVERFSSVLIEAGWPRMAARVFVVLMASEPGKLTAAELAERLQISPAAVSGAVRLLIQLDLISRVREPGSRRDFYILEEDVWYHVITRRIQVMTRWGDQLASGRDAAGKGTEAANRLDDMIAFFLFLRDELPELMERWHNRHAQQP
jgi:DNA-binding transcriptional regulator GbsR (MarR family)